MTGKDTSDSRKQHSIYRELAPYFSLGYQLIASAALLGGAGWWIDAEFHTQPLWFAIGLGLGCAVGLVSVIRTALQSDKKR